MSLVNVDVSVEKYRAVWNIGSVAMPDQYIMGFRYVKNLFMGLARYDLVEELDRRISEEIEKPLGTDLFTVQMIYKNMPYMMSFTRTQSEYIDELGTRIYKYQIKQRFERIMEWVFRTMVELEPHIRFRAEKPIL